MSYFLRTSIGQKIITDDFAKQLLQSQKFLSKCLRIFAYRDIIHRNLDELITFLRSYQDNFNGLDFDSVECNRLLYNTLNTFYAYEQSFNKGYGREIRQIKQDFHRRYFNYSIISALRDYMEHSNLGVSNVVVTLGKYGSKAKAYINLKRIANDIMRRDKFDGFKQKIDKMIEDKKEIELELLPLFERFKSLFYEMQLEVWKMLASQILEGFKCLGNIVRATEVETHDVFLYNDSRYICPISNSYHNFYVNFSSRFIIPENVMSKTDEGIKEFYKALSVDYYGETDKYYPQNI